MEDALLEYEERVESFAEWAKDIYDVNIVYSSHDDEPPDSVQEQWAEEGEPWKNTEWKD